MVFSLGSIQSDTYNFINPFPTHLSGTPHENLIWRKIVLVGNYMQQTLGSVGIDNKYYQVLFDMTMSSLLASMQASDSSAASKVRLGDFSFADSVGGGTDIEKAKKYFEQQGIEGLESVRFMNWDALVYKAT